jgi:hypothetical protein
VAAKADERGQADQGQGAEQHVMDVMGAQGGDHIPFILPVQAVVQSAMAGEPAGAHLVPSLVAAVPATMAATGCFFMIFRLRAGFVCDGEFLADTDVEFGHAVLLGDY